MKNGIPKNIMLSGITNVVISAGRLIISNELKILLPTTFPRARLSLFFFALLNINILLRINKIKLLGLFMEEQIFVI